MCQDFYYKMRQFYYKMRQLLENAKIFFTKSGVLQNASVNTSIATFRYIFFCCALKKYREVSICCSYNKTNNITK